MTTIALLQRVVWNTAGWRRPTAATREGGYCEEHGFGHEEWNFQHQDAIDGSVLGYVYWTPGAKSLLSSGGTFDIGFWSIHPGTRRRLLVGRYKDARIATDAFLERANEQFEARGIYERRGAELQAVIPGLSSKKAVRYAVEGIEHGFVRFRCPVSQAIAYTPSEYADVPTRIGDRGLSLRFASPTFVAAIPALASRQGSPKDYQQASPLSEDAYFRETGARMQTITPLHSMLSNSFAEWLRQENFANIRQEASRVDVEFGAPGELYRAELKVCHAVGSTKSIREALGQLLEYNHYGTRTPAQHWWIVLDEEPSTSDVAFVATLRRDRQLPLKLVWQTATGFDFDRDCATLPG